MSQKSRTIPWRSKCCVKGCSTRICSGVKMHGFPREDRYPELYQHWLDAVRTANKTPIWVPLKSNKVCAFHFDTVQNTRIRVPTVFPNSEGQVASASWEQNDDDDFDNDEYPTEDGYEEDEMDVYEDSIAVSSIMDEDGMVHIENTDTVGYIDEDSSTTYDDIEEKYNTIVGDVVSTLVTDDNIMDEDTNITYEEGEDDAAPTYNNEVEEEGTTVFNNVEEEIVYDDGDFMFNDEENPTFQTHTFSEQIDLNEKALGDNDYCVVVIKQGTEETIPETTKDVSPINTSSQSRSKQKSKKKKFTRNKKSRKSPHKKSSRKKVINKAAQPLPSSLSESSLACTLSEESAVIPSESTISLSDEVRELLIKGQEILPSETSSVKLQELEVMSKKADLKSPSKKGRLKSPSQEGTLKHKETVHTAKSPDKQVMQKTSPSKGKKEQATTTEKSKKEQKKTPSKRKETKTSPAEELQVEPNEQKTAPSKGKENKTLPTEELQVEPKEQKTSPSKGKETEASSTEELTFELKEQKTLASKDEELDKSTSSKRKGLNWIKLDDLLLDGQPIKLKECSVNISKPLTKPKTKTKAQCTLNVENNGRIKDETQKTKKGEKQEIPTGNNLEKNDEIVPKSSSEFLNALSLKTSHSQEDVNSSLRRSARIRAGAGKRRKSGIRRSWSVALKESPKKKLKVEVDETSQSSESVPYDFENEEDDPDVGISDLDSSDKSEYEAKVKPKSDFSSVSEKAKSNLQSELNGVTKKRRRGRLPYLAVGEDVSKPKFYVYQRVRQGDQATQVGLPGKCDGFIFDVVRDDPHNVGVSCNIFYHYQPKHYRHHSTWARLKRNMHTPSMEATKITIQPLISIANKKLEPTNSDAQKDEDSVDTPYQRQSKDDKSNRRTTSENSKNVIQCQSLESCIPSNDRVKDTEDLIEEAENTFSKKTENVDLHEKEVRGGSEYPGNNCRGGIKVEPAMDISISTGKVDGHLVEFIEADGKSWITEDDISSTGNTAELSEVEVKQEKEFHDDEDTETIRVNQDSCIAKDLCEVSHYAGGTTDFCESLSKPGVEHSNRVIPESMDTDDTTTIESHAGQDCSTKLVERDPDHYTDETNTENVEETKDTSDTRPDDQVGSGNSSERTETFLEFPCRTLAHSLNRSQWLNQDSNPTRTEDIATLSMPNIDSGNEADSLMEDDKIVVNKGSEPGVKNLASDIVGDELMDAIYSSERNEPDPGNASVDSPAKSTEVEMYASRDDGVMVKEINHPNTSANSNYAAGRTGGFPNVDPSSEPLLGADVFCDLKYGENVEFGDSESVQAGSGCEAECQDYVKLNCGKSEVGKCLDAKVDSALLAVEDQTSSSSTNKEIIKQSTETGNVLACPGFEAECQNEAEHPRKGKNEVNERLNSPDFSGDDSSDSFIEVPIPDIDFIPPILKETAMKLPQHPKLRTDETPFVRDCENEANLEKCHTQNLVESPDLENQREVPDSGRTVSNENCPSEGEVNPMQSSQEVFDSIERNLEKMFEIHR